MSMLGVLKNFDLYRKVPKDLTKGSVPGAIMSLTCLVIVIILIGWEMYCFFSLKTEMQMIVDTPRNLEKLRINMNISLPRIPCHLLALDTEDALRSGMEDLQARSIAKIPALNEETGTYGCRIAGYLNVPKVPGNFHLSTHGREVLAENVNMQHTVNALFFTDAPRVIYPPGATVPTWRFSEHNVEAELLNALMNTPDEDDVSGLFRPLDGIVKSSNRVVDGLAVSHEYYIQIVPTVLEFPDGRTKHTYQFTYNFNDVETLPGETPAIFFKYEISAITVKITRGRGSFMHFLLQLCAIIGGIFTVSGLIAGITARVIKAVMVSTKLE